VPRVCEICEARGAALDQEPSGKLTRLLLDDRVLALCDEHHAQVRAAKVRHLAELFELFREPDGQRAALSRRSPVDRRVFPPRPEGRRRGRERRDSR